ncbi:MAG: DNA ligase D [Acidipila sp.]|nr:DNA ligase D [Acidipila sp.]
MAGLVEYNRKRNFQKTAEPKGRAGRTNQSVFVVQRHAARRLHFDFRIQVNGALASWAVPKGPPQEQGEKRLAIHVEDHPLDYAGFEGDIPKGNYGAGHVDIWDEGTFEVEGAESAAAQIERGDLKLRLTGKRLNGRFVLVKLRHSARPNEWLFIHKSDPAVSAARSDRSETPAAKPEGQRANAKRTGATGATSAKISDLEALQGAKKSPMPSQISLTLAQLQTKAFSGAEWLFEIKWDGERALGILRPGDFELRARSGRNITAEYPELKEIGRQFNAREAILDGEIVVLDEQGRSDFRRIQPRFGVLNPPPALQQKNPVTYYAFDLLYCDGYDLRRVALEGRKALLQKLLRTSDKIRFSDHVIENGVELFAMAREQELEGIIAKRRDSRYAGKRTSDWVKLKIVHDLDVVIGGWTAPRKTRDHFGSLLMGLYQGSDLKYIGSVGTGFDQELLAKTAETLRQLAAAVCPFSTVPQLKETAHWVTPELVARVKYGQWTNDKKLRQPVFLGFQEDREARDCHFETQGTATAPQAMPQQKQTVRSPESSRVKAAGITAGAAGTSLAHAKNLEQELAEGKGEALNVELDGKKLSLTHLNKPFFPQPRLRKRDVLLYYLRIAPCLLPFLKDRPLVLKRYPDGIAGKFFFQKEASESRPEWLRTVDIFSKERGATMPYIIANDRATLLYLTNLGCIDHNPWSSCFDDQEHPDYIFFDLDPTEGTPFESALLVASAIYAQLQALELRCYLKTSGASGFHIFVPIVRKYSYEQARLFAGAIGQRVQTELPKLVTFERIVSKRRKGTVLIDALQNALGKPLAAAYSLRPFPGAPVSTPVTESELAKKMRPEQLNVETIFQRLKRYGDLWKDFWENRQLLDEAVNRAE